MILVTLLGGCVMTTGDKLAGIFLTMRNSLVDWSIIADSKTVPKIFLDVLINNKYPFDGWSISGLILIVITQITWAVLSPNKKNKKETVDNKGENEAENGVNAETVPLLNDAKIGGN
ncbi:EamA-like_transporter family protein [Hexamita inflata]|uniref:EamA-like transporter family protein n=1 Tax=Hexamita inflata TaxID=28002 RepID=A0AA86Q9P5_9EUKA|nr:EamA-like transporter family protein [Hexamita inflata]CAI9977390.1 EamA-like transporter family protein [Hexamita inflata]